MNFRLRYAFLFPVLSFSRTALRAVGSGTKQANRVTKESSTLIDLIVNVAVISVRGIFPFSLSHDMVGCIRKIHNVTFSPKIINCRNYSSYNPEVMREDFKTVDWSPVYSACDVNQALKYFNGIVRSNFYLHAPHIVKKIRGKACPWINSDIRPKLMVDRDPILRKFRKTKSEEDWNLYRKLGNLCNNKMKYAKAEYRKDLLNENVTTPRKFWSTIKDIFPTKNKLKNPSICND